MRQSFSHGRSKARRRRKGQTPRRRRARRGQGGPALAPSVASCAEQAAAPRRLHAHAARHAPTQSRRPSGVVLRTLTEEERSARAHALADSRDCAKHEERKIAEARSPSLAAAARQSIAAEREAAEARKREEESRRKHDEETKRKAGEVAKKRFGGDETHGNRARRASRARGRRRRSAPPAAVARRGARVRPRRRARPARRAEKRRGRLTVGHRAYAPTRCASALSPRSAAASSGSRAIASNEPKEKIVREVTIPEAITIQDLRQPHVRARASTSFAC